MLGETGVCAYNYCIYVIYIYAYVVLRNYLIICILNHILIKDIERKNTQHNMIEK